VNDVTNYGLTGASGYSVLPVQMFWRSWPRPRETSTAEWVDDAHASVHEISTISRGNRQTVHEGRRRDEAILDWHGFPGCAKTRQQFRPFQPRVRVPGKAVEKPNSRVEPAFQGGPLPPPGKDENPESEFAENDGIDRDIRLMCAKPRHDPRIGRWLVTLQKFSKKRRWVMLDLHLSVSGGEKGKVDDPKEG